MTPDRPVCACQQVKCSGHPRPGEQLCEICKALCQEPGIQHVSSGKVREMLRVPRD